MGLDGGEPATPEWAATICGVASRGDRVLRARLCRGKACDAFPGLLHPARVRRRRDLSADHRPAARDGQLRSAWRFDRLNQQHPARTRVGRLPVPPIPPQPSAPVARWPDAILEGRRGGYARTSGPSTTWAAISSTRAATSARTWPRLRSWISRSPTRSFMTPTARHCDVIFPTATAFEKEDIGLPWAGNYLLLQDADRPAAGPGAQRLRCRGGAGRSAWLWRTPSLKAAARPHWIEPFIAHSEVADPGAFRRDRHLPRPRPGAGRVGRIRRRPGAPSAEHALGQGRDRQRRLPRTRRASLPFPRGSRRPRIAVTRCG